MKIKEKESFKKSKVMKSNKKKLSKKSKILAIGDVHGDTGLIKRLAKRAKKEEVDLVFLAGDLTFIEQSADNLIGPFLKFNKPVLLLHGNHESVATVDFLAEMYPNAKNLHGYSIKRGDLGIFGAGGGDVIMRTPDREIFNALKKGHERIKGMKKKIMVTHMHAWGSKSELSGWPGSKAVAKAIKEFNPDILISGHIHETSGVEERIGNTLVVNVARKERIFEI